MNKFLLALTLLLALCITTLQAQNAGSSTQYLTLQQCVDIAMEKNLSIKLAANTFELARLDNLQAKWNYAPTLNGAITLNQNSGGQLQTQINPLTGDLVAFRFSNAFTTSSPSLTAQIPLFAGLSRYYVLNQTKNAYQAQQNALANQKNTVLISVIRGFLQVIFDQTQVDVVNYRIKTLQGQLDRAKRLYDAGGGILFDVLNIQSQIAVENNNLITAQNTLNSDRVTLLQLLQLNSESGTGDLYQLQAFDTTGLVAKIQTDMVPPVADVERTALETFPNIKQQEFNILAARYGRKNAWALYLPTLNFTYRVSQQYNTIISNVSYFDQLGLTVGQFYGITLNIPIMNGWNANRQSRGALVLYNNAQVQLEQTKNQLISDVRRAVLDLNASKARIQNIISQQAAQDENFVNAEARFNSGLINFVQYLEVLNNRTSLQQQKIQSVYEYILRRKIVDFYNGKPLTFNEK